MASCVADDANLSNDSQFDNSRQQTCVIGGMIFEVPRAPARLPLARAAVLLQKIGLPNLGEQGRLAMKALRITYWVSTVVFAMVFATTGTMYLIHHPVMVAKFRELGYPLYVLNLLGIAKVLGVIALVVPKYPR